MAKKWNLVIDVARCDNCRLCFLAVKDEYVGNDFPGYSAAQPGQGQAWLDIRRKERGTYPLVQARFMPVMCNHCDDAPCMEAARDGPVRKRPDGIVIIDPEKAKGQRQIVDACPYGTISWNEERQIPQAWPFDAHLLDEGWTRTRAEQACPMNVFRVEGVEECAAGVEVVLEKDGREVGRATTDSFGEFVIDRLEPNSSGYHLRAASPSGRFSRQFDLGAESRYLGVMALAAG